jgi:hypothetical protein
MAKINHYLCDPGAFLYPLLYSVQCEGGPVPAIVAGGVHMQDRVATFINSQVIGTTQVIIYFSLITCFIYEKVIQNLYVHCLCQNPAINVRSVCVV